jgi:ligand-binding sensor domain-containing protein/signal transduction histidine kinase
MAWRSLIIVFVLVIQHVYGPTTSAANRSSDISSDYLVKFWRTEHGLPDNSIAAIAQTSDGYLWLGTTMGLVRFDGSRCTVFTPADTGALETASVATLVSDTFGSLWIGFAHGGIVRWDKGSFERIVPSDSTGAIHCLLPVSRDQVIVGSERGLFVLSKDKTIRAIHEGTPVRAISANRDGTIWAGTGNGLWKFENEKLLPVAPRNVEITSLDTTPGGNIWIGGPRVGLLEVRSGDDAPRRVWPVTEVKTLCSSRGGELWIAPGNDTIERLTMGSRTTESLPIAAKAIRCLFEDRDGVLWVGTEGDGLAQIRPKTLKLLTRGQAIVSVTQGFDSQVIAVAEDGQIYRATNSALAPLSIEGAASGSYFETVLLGRSGGLWLGSRFDGLQYWPGPGTRLEKRSGSPGISALFEDRRGRLWLGSSSDGVLVWERDGTRTIRGPDGEVLREATCFADGQEGTVWIGTRRFGLAEWKEGILQWHRSEPFSKQSRIQCLYSDLEGNLWIGSDQGLVLRREGRFSVATTKDGLHDDSVCQIVEDFRGNLWMGSRRGLFRVSKAELNNFFLQKSESVHSLPVGPDEGLSGLEGIAGAQPTCWKTADGKLWFAARQGLAVVDPLKTGFLDATAPVVLEEIRVDNQLAFGPVELMSSNQIAIPVGYRHISIRFTALDFTSPERASFRFRLAGLDRHWVASGANRIASYGRIPAGEYRFEVAIRKRDGSWAENPTTATILIAPRYWETAWFRALIAGVVASVPILFRLQRVAKEKEIDALRQQITRDLHDDLGSNIGSIALLSEALQKPSTDVGSSHDLAREIHSIARQTLESMGDAVWFVDPDKDTSRQLIAHLRDISDSMLKNIPHEFRAPEKFGIDRMPLDLKRGVVLIFKESLHNVQRHARASHVDIVVDFNGSVFSFSIRDNGVGFDPGNSTAGHGLKNMQHRARKLRGELRIKSEPGRGTETFFQVKVA